MRVRRAAPEATLSGVSLDRLEVVTAPGGAADLLQGLKMQGGVTQVNDGSHLFVRGGEPAEAPVWVDGGRMAYPGTFETLDGGLFGVLSPTVMREAVFSSGGFSARFGNALSGALDVRTVGRPAAPRARAGIDLVGVSGEFSRSPRSADGTYGLVFEPRAGIELKAIGLMQGDGATRWIESHGHEGDFESRGGTRHLGLSGSATRRDGARAAASLSASRRETAFRFGVLDRARTDRSLAGSLERHGGNVSATARTLGLPRQSLQKLLRRVE